MNYLTVPQLRLLCKRKNGQHPSSQYLHQLIIAKKLFPDAQIGRAYVFSKRKVKRFLEEYFPLTK